MNKRIYLFCEGDDDIEVFKAIYRDSNFVEVKIGGKENSGTIYSQFESKLKDRLSSFQKESELRIAIVLDQDNEVFEDILEKINRSLLNILKIELSKYNCVEEKMATIGEFEVSTKIGLFIIGDGNTYFDLDELLQLVQVKPSPVQDCLEVWFSCIEGKISSPLTDREMKKMKRYYYLKYDTLTSKQREKAGAYATVKSAIQRNIWNVDDVRFSDLKVFLTTLGT